MSDQTITYAEVVTEYRIGLRLWSEAKALYPPKSREVFQAQEQIEMLEELLLDHRKAMKSMAVHFAGQRNS
jgi:hypothetical protein